MLYDNNKNLIGSSVTNDSIMGLDTLKISQNKFYNSKDNLIQIKRNNDDKYFNEYFDYNDLIEI
ncbi:MAG: hypothetical protein CMH15_08870 [Mesonia sp.]|uniref:Uncharacterized protein n=1 Tax=Mesonia oceanica TaxID=2687242 RepID=A0AC61Y9R1_9FLAO|nr:hypothetical protein [Mesonia sp.]VVV01241.1 hypothetical protein FVB9532_02526 [Mesonia oceanica]|tara:strand:+ start:302 stop:493 length:192 start_codon:yes stop_codon:yes gene_type:complete